MSGDSADGIRRWVEASGFALEMRVGQRARLHGFEVRQSFRYDDVEGQPREIDLVLGDLDDIGPTATFAVLATIECKRTDAPWVAMQAALGPWHWKLNVLARPMSRHMEIALDRFGDSVADDPLLAPPSAFAIKVAYEKEGRAPREQRDVVFDGARQAIDAGNRMTAGPGDRHHGLVFPVVVTSASMFGCTLDSTAAIDVYPVQRVAMAIRHKGDRRVVHVVTEDGMPDFLRDLQRFTDSLRTLVSSIVQ